jgi:acyl-CoA hydrolase/RimJ/RimL family protein N-acetyltransferase
VLAPPWKQTYAAKCCTAEQAVRLLRPGRRVFVGSGAAEPAGLVEAMVRGAPHLHDNEIVHLLTLGPAPYAAPEQEGRFRHTAFFVGPNVREAVQEGRADFMPVFLSEIPRLIASRRLRVDAALVQVSPPDAHGFCSLGVSVDVVRAAVDSAGLVLAEVNPRMPRTRGDSLVHVDALDRLVPVDAPLPELLPPPPDEVDRAIARHVAGLVPDGATLQVGIGKLPDAVLAALSGRSDLGVHTEMLSDGVMRLARAGAVTGRRKTLLPGKIVTSFVMGSRELYAWVDDNPAVELRASDFTNDPFVIAQNDLMVAINAALAVDLTGQVAADTVGGRFFSGIGGQVDFVRGAARSRGGKPIIALRSTAKKGQISRICAALEAGAGVVTSRGDVHYVVTEYGVADLWGKSVRQRAAALVDVAHPDHRAELLAAAKARKYVFPDQIAARAPYPFREACAARLPGGEGVLVRPARIADEGPLQEFFYALSDETVYRRFFGAKNTFSHAEMQKLVDLDYEKNLALVACAGEGAGESEAIVGVAVYDADPADGLAEVAFVVRDDWQGKGLGTLLMRRIAEAGRARGLRGFKADVLAENQRMLAVFHESGLEVSARLDGGQYRVKMLFGTNHAS